MGLVDMSGSTPIPLTASPIGLGSRDFDAVVNWPFADPFVARLLRDDIPQRMLFGNCRVWLFRDPERRPVGFGSLDLCNDHRAFASDQMHTYIPLLAVNPKIKSLGYGTTIVRHLIDEAAILVNTGTKCHDALFLDVYTSSDKAIAVYRNCGFEQITPLPIPDPMENGKTFIVMAKRVSTATV